MKLKRFLVLSLGVLFVFPAGAQTQSALESKPTEDVCEVALRYFVTLDGTGGAAAICISAPITLPPNFINRFADHKPPVVWSIQCTPDLWGGVKFAKTNEPAALVRIAGIRWISEDEAEVSGGRSGGDFIRRPNTIRIVRSDGRWFVKQDRNSAQKTPPKQPEESDDQIITAVVRHASLGEKGIVFLGVSSHDPSPETLRLLSVWYVRVLPASRAVYVPVPNEVGVWKEKKTGELGRYFQAGIEKRVKDNRVEVAAGWWQPCGTYTVVFQNGSWSVENYKAWEMCW